MQTVYPVIIEERSEDGSLLLQIHDGLALSLTKVSVAAEALRLRSTLNSAIVDETVNGSEIQASLFEDKLHMATVSLTKTSDGVRVSGLLSPTESIQPASFEARPSSGSLPHIVQRIKQPLDLERTIEEKVKGIVPRTCNDTTMPDLVTIEVYVVSDNTHNRRFDERNLLLYVCIFMNTIMAIFNNLICPKVKLELVGVEKSNKTQEDEYIFGNEQLMKDVTSLHMFEMYARNNLGIYGYPDVVLLLTGRDVYESSHGGINRKVAGIAYEGGVCTDRCVALAEDIPGAFSGVIEAAHELGHSLGASHDGTEPNRHIQGHPGSLRCSSSSGRLMTYVDGGYLRYKFSKCNEEEIRHVLRARGKDCWDMKASKTYSIKKVFPGDILKPSDYCKKLYKNNKAYNSVDFELRRHCKIKCCAIASGGKRACGLHPMLDHMTCGQKKKCFQGICSSEKDLRAS
uniref:Putative tick salivary metalloprotease n=1 Tax=Hyalomma excavatum TaxID=257692 RepID=A0A131XMR0_9ACAR